MEATHGRRDVIVPAEAFVRTYDHPSYADPWEAVEDYQKVLEVQSEHPDRGSTAVASRVELPRGRVRPWLDGARPDCVRGLQVAESHGWVNVNPSVDHDVLRGLNALLAWVFSGGSISAENYTPYWVVDDARDRELIDSAAELAAVELDYTRSASDYRAQEVRPIEHASVLGRVLSVMGAPMGDKNEGADISLPEYLDVVRERVAREFVQLYVHNRGQIRDDSDLITFREMRDEAYLRSLARLIQQLTDEPVTVSDRNVHISAPAARKIADWEPPLT